MELIRGQHNIRPRHHGCVVTIGGVDGVHLGHQALLRQLRERADQLQLPLTVVSFEPSPREFFLTTQAPARLQRLREKCAALQCYDVDRFCCLRFDAALSQLSATAFVEQILVQGLGMRWLVVGHDFRFGKGREGTFDMLQAMGLKFNFGVDEVAPFLFGGERVSSTLVRAALAAGDLQRATQLLGRPYRLSGRVVRGQQLGRTLGFPTANLNVHHHPVPLQGVFAVRVQGAGLQQQPAVASIGTRPVVQGVRPVLEVHLFDFSGDLYRRHIDVDFLAYLRAERNFADLESLVAQMQLDALQARQLLQETLVKSHSA